MLIVFHTDFSTGSFRFFSIKHARENLLHNDKAASGTEISNISSLLAYYMGRELGHSHGHERNYGNIHSHYIHTSCGNIHNHSHNDNYYLVT